MNPRMTANNPYCSLPRLRTRIGVDTKPTMIGNTHATTLKNEFAAIPRRFSPASPGIVQRLYIRLDDQCGSVSLVEPLHDEFASASGQAFTELGIIFQAKDRIRKCGRVAGLNKNTGLEMLEGLGNGEYVS